MGYIQKMSLSDVSLFSEYVCCSLYFKYAYATLSLDISVIGPYGPRLICK